METPSRITPLATLTLLSVLVAGCSDDAATEPGTPEDCSPDAATPVSWSFEEGMDGWTSDSLTTDPYNTVRWEAGHVILRGRGAIDAVPDSWMHRDVTLANSCELTLAYTRRGLGLSTGYLRIRYETGGSSRLVQDWTSVTGSGSEATRTADLSEWAGTSGRFVFEWEDQEDSGGEQDPGMVLVEAIAIE